MYLKRELHLAVSESPWANTKYYELGDEVKVTLVDGIILRGYILHIEEKSLTLEKYRNIAFSLIAKIEEVEE